MSDHHHDHHGCGTIHGEPRTAARGPEDHGRGLRDDGVREPRGDVDARGFERARVVDGHAAAQDRFRAAREERHLPVHERRRIAGRHLRSQADAREVSRAAAADRRDQDRAAHRRAHEVALQLQALRAVGDRGQRALPARGRVRGRHLRDPLDAHRDPEPRALAAHDEHGAHPAGPALAGIVAHVRARNREPEPARIRGALPGPAHRGGPRRSGATPSSRPSTRAPTSPTRCRGSRTTSTRSA